MNILYPQATPKNLFNSHVKFNQNRFSCFVYLESPDMYHNEKTYLILAPTKSLQNVNITSIIQKQTPVRNHKPPHDHLKLTI